ncbi:germination lipoprotein GerS-related protein [Clostridium sp.]|uniref:germination lipoprotein GerS-related protein n=1 Tax=Clostridium sp. TaxID=1506 RepID=UPI002FDD9FAE
MRKKLILGIMSFALIIFFSSCNKNTKNTEEIIYYLKDLNSYSCNVNISIKNSKEEIKYSGKQFYHVKYGNRLELGKDEIIFYKQDKVVAKRIGNGSICNYNKNFDSLFKFCFINQYISLIYTNEKIENSFQNINNQQYQIIHLDIPGNNKNISKAELYVSTKNSTPTYLIIYDSDGKERVKVQYTEFKANPELGKDVFDIS